MGRWGCKSDFSDDNVPTLFYTDILGVKATVTGAILLFVTYSDVSINLILGVSTNRMNVYSRKYRPWLLWIAINIQQSSRNDKVDIHIIQQQFSSIVAANYVEN